MNLTITTHHEGGQAPDVIVMHVLPDEDVTIEIGSEINIVGASNHALDEPMPVIRPVPVELGVAIWSDAITLYPMEVHVEDRPVGDLPG